MENQYCRCKPEDQQIEEYERGTYGCETCGKEVEPFEPIYDEEEERK